MNMSNHDIVCIGIVSPNMISLHIKNVELFITYEAAKIYMQLSLHYLLLV